jgi:hypothetical protein
VDPKDAHYLREFGGRKPRNIAGRERLTNNPQIARASQLLKILDAGH